MMMNRPLHHLIVSTPSLFALLLLFVGTNNTQLLFVESFVIQAQPHVVTFPSRQGSNDAIVTPTAIAPFRQAETRLGMFDPKAAIDDISRFMMESSLFSSSSSTASTIATSQAVGVLSVSTAEAAFSSSHPLILSASKLLSSDPVILAEILNDMSHVALDFANTLFGQIFSNSRTACTYSRNVIIRGAAIIGRLFALSADYLPDHRVVPEELVFQMVMLTLAWVALFRALLPWALATLVFPASTGSWAGGLMGLAASPQHGSSSSTITTSSSSTVRDGKAFSLLFQPAGVTWSQFKAMSAFCIDWITLEPGQVVMMEDGTTGEENNNDQHIYWLYSGEMVVHHNGKAVWNVTRDSPKAPAAGTGILGEERLLEIVDQVSKNKKTYKTVLKNKKKNKACEETTTCDATNKHVTVTAGQGPRVEDPSHGSNNETLTNHRKTTVMRIHADKLKLLMQSDPDLVEAIRTLVLQCMQDKLAAQQLDSTR